MDVKNNKKMFEFKQNKNNDWYPVLKLDTGEINIEMPDNKIDKECLEEFLIFYSQNHLKQIKKARNAFKSLAKAIGWWKTEDLNRGEFNLNDITIKYLHCNNMVNTYYKFGKIEYELYFSFEGDENHFYIDTYGLWIASFEGEHLTGVKREQI